MNVLNVLIMVLVYMMEPYIWLKCMETLGWKGRGGRKSAFLVWVGYYIITLVKQYFSLTGMNSNASTFLLLIMTVYILCTTILLFQGTIFKKLPVMEFFFYPLLQQKV